MPLDAKQVELKGRELTKAAESSTADPSTILRFLTELRTGVLASESLLRSTKIGVTVNKLKQHSSAPVRTAAAELVTKWRNDVKRSGASGGNSGASTPKPMNSGSASSGAGGKNGVASKRPDVPKEKRNVKTDRVDYKVTGNETRDSCVKLMYDGLAFMSEDSPDHILTLATQVESATFTAHPPETSEPYKARIRMLYQNLRSKTDGTLRQNVLSGTISATTLVGMSHDDMKSESLKAAEAKMMKENMDKAMVAQEEQSISTSLRCGKCGQKKVTYTQAQTRSADEPMTTFCTCLNCGNRWKFS